MLSQIPFLTNYKHLRYATNARCTNGIDGYAIVYSLFIMSYQLRWVMLRADGVYASDWRI